MNKNTSKNVKVQGAVLDAVRLISHAAFDDRLGEYSISFTLMVEVGCITMHVMFNGAHVPCFNDMFVGISKGSLISFPESNSKIEEFNADVEKSLADIFAYIKEQS